MDYYIYKLACKDPLITDIYVGSTKNTYIRNYAHKNACNNPNHILYNSKVYKFIRNNGGWENWESIIIETIFCNNKKEALLLEKKWILELNAKLNKKIPTNTQKDSTKQYYETHKEQTTQYRETHKEQLKEYAKKYYESHKEKAKQYYKQYNKNRKSK